MYLAKDIELLDVNLPRHCMAWVKWGNPINSIGNTMNITNCKWYIYTHTLQKLKLSMKAMKRPPLTV